jgi:hypothetical protein
MSEIGWTVLFFGSVAAVGAAYAVLRLALGATDPIDFPSQPPTGPMDSN